MPELRAGGELDYTEEKLLQGFIQYIERLRPRLVTYNGRGFDIPVIKYRAMAHGLSAPILFESDYLYRYNIDAHCDLLEVLSDFGASTRMRLADVCAVLNIPSKIGMDGSEVLRSFEAGKIDSIRSYCEVDVISTYLLYLRSMFLRGAMRIEEFAKAQYDVHQYLSTNQNKKPHLRQYLVEWERLAGSVSLP